jgi:hypothetical protein
VTRPPAAARPLPEWSRQMLEQVTVPGGDADELRVLSRMADDAQAHLDAVRELRDACAARLRLDGVAMVDIARWARVSDSYLTRRLLRRGLTRRTGQALPPEQRSTG